MTKVTISSLGHQIDIDHDGADLAYIIEKAQKLFDDTKPPGTNGGLAFGFSAEREYRTDGFAWDLGRGGAAGGAAMTATPHLDRARTHMAAVDLARRWIDHDPYYRGQAPSEREIASMHLALRCLTQPTQIEGLLAARRPSPPPAANVATDRAGVNVVRLPLTEILHNWRPGSLDRTWPEEFEDRGSDARIVEMWGPFTDFLIPSVLQHGWACVEPVTLGWDGGRWAGRVWRGRVWAGHARLFLAARMGVPQVLADLVPAGERRGGKHGHCAPAAGRAEEAATEANVP